jgi:hypothetical protein
MDPVRLSGIVTAAVAAFAGFNLAATPGPVVRAALRPPVRHFGVQQSKDTIFQRPVELSLVMSNSRTYDGTYSATGISRACGNLLLATKGMKDGFNVEFPDSGDFEIVDLVFATDTLKPGTTTASFYVAASVKAKKGGRPPGFILRTNEPRFKETGTAKLTLVGSTATLKVNGRNAEGETLDLTVVCRKRNP